MSDATLPPLILSEVREGVAIVTFNRPARLNAWAPETGTTYFNLLEQHALDPEVRVILVTGQGRAFCAGADMSALSAMAGSAATLNLEKRPYWFPLTIGKPIVAAIRGHCIGIGLQQALCCDIRFLAWDAKISTVYARRGLVGELGISWLLPRIVGMGATMDLLLSGRTIDADECYKIGLANRLVEVEVAFDVAFDYCRQIAKQCAPWSMRTIKQQIYADLTSSLPESYARAEAAVAEALTGAAFGEGMKAFAEKRSASYLPLDPSLALLDIAPNGVGSRN